jgi:iron-sulfur cluster insertion protein
VPTQRDEASRALHSITEREDDMITMTSVAEEKIRELMQEEKDTIGLRVFVKGGGCHGYQYGMAFESQIGEDDTVIDKGDVKVIMDSQSAPLLAGCEVDFQDTVQGSGFAIKNPQAKTTCGCGSSFSA